MSDTGSTNAGAASWVPLAPDERRVVGVLAEKAKTTPEYYPMTIAAVVSGCNQKSNRDPVVEFDADDVEEILHALRKKGAAVLVEAGGRVPRWKHTLYDWLKVTKVELAVVVELLLRGPQTEGDLRARASRMEPLPDLGTLQNHLEALSARGLVVYLSPPGQKRGVVVAHGLYPPEELEKVRRNHAHSAASTRDDDRDEPPARGSSSSSAASAAWKAEADALRDEMNALRGRVESLADELRRLSDALGA